MSSFHRQGLPMHGTARLYNCARCQCQVLICSDCDRGNIYCLICSPLAHAESIRKASQRYQNSYQGKLNHAARQQRYRSRLKQKVTHVGSPSITSDDVLDRKTAEHLQHEKLSVRQSVCCHFCQKTCFDFLRVDYLRDHSGKNLIQSLIKRFLHTKGGHIHDHFNRIRGKNPALFSCREVAHRDDCPSTEHSS